MSELLRSHSQSLTVQTPCKVNLFFEILGRRADGYHEIATLAAPVSFYDQMTFTLTDADAIEFSCRINEQTFQKVQDENEPEALQIPGQFLGNENTETAADLNLNTTAAQEARKNLAYKAAALIKETFHVREGIKIDLKKNIPPMSGLGAGSANAAYAMMACVRLWGLDVEQDALIRLAARLGADVPLFFAPGAVVAQGIGERITPHTVGVRKPILLWRPPVGLSTKEVYSRVRVPESPRNVWDIVSALESQRWDDFYRLVFNRLEEFSAPLTPWIERILNRFRQLDCACCAMSGSGSACFALYEDRQTAERAVAQLKDEPGFICLSEVIV